DTSRYRGRKPYLSALRVPGRARGAPMPLEDGSDRSNKVYDTMKSAGITSEDKMRDAEAITKMSKLPKNFVLTALQELQAKGYAKRLAREKAAGYWIVRWVVALICVGSGAHGQPCTADSSLCDSASVHALHT